MAMDGHPHMVNEETLKSYVKRLSQGLDLRTAIYEANHARSTALRMRAERDEALARAVSFSPDKLAEEIMARIERDGAIHRDSLIDVIKMVSGTAEITRS